MELSESMERSGVPRGEGTLISYIRRLGPFLGFKILFYGIFIKMNIFGSMMQSWTDTFWGHHTTVPFWGSFQYILGLFLEAKVQNGK